MIKEHECIQQEFIGKAKEFMNSSKGNKPILWSLIFTMLIQIGTFLYLWGALTQVVNKNNDYLWGSVTTGLNENTRNVDKILTKLENVRLVAYMQNQK